jgi:DNA-binding NarL/FixJ family response regulator
MPLVNLADDLLAEVCIPNQLQAVMSGESNAQNNDPAPAPVPVVLVVEDHELTRRAVGRKLQAAGFEVILVPTAADALIVVQRMAIHVMVLDLNLPDDDAFFTIHDGFAMLDWLRRRVGAFRFHIVVHTSQRSDNVFHAAHERGVFAVCHKERDLSGLVQCVTQAVNDLNQLSA